jgi:hypothetical protein
MGVRLGGGVPFVEWASELPYAARLRHWSAVAVGKPSLNRANTVACGRPEAG